MNIGYDRNVFELAYPIFQCLWILSNNRTVHCSKKERKLNVQFCISLTFSGRFLEITEDSQTHLKLSFVNSPSHNTHVVDME